MAEGNERNLERNIVSLQVHIRTISGDVLLPPGRKAVGTHWIFKIKQHADSSINQHKARWVAKGYSQHHSINYNKTFAPVMHLENLHFLLSLTTLHDLEVYQININSAFLQANVNEQVYITQPEGFKSLKHPDYICLLKKSLYGLKQAPLLWNRTFNSHMRALSFTLLKANPCIYMHRTRSNQSLTIVSVYINNCLIIGSHSSINKTKKRLAAKIKIKDLRAASSILGVKVLRDQHLHTIHLHQQGHIDGILCKFNMSNSKPAPTPMVHGLVLAQLDSTLATCHALPYRQAIGSLLYLALASRPNITFTVSFLSCQMDTYNETHWAAIKHILHYLNRTWTFASKYSCDHSTDTRHDPCVPVGYSDTDWGSNEIDHKSVSSYVFLITSGSIMWSLRKQTMVALRVRVRV